MKTLKIILFINLLLIILLSVLVIYIATADFSALSPFFQGVSDSLIGVHADKLTADEIGYILGSSSGLLLVATIVSLIAVYRRSKILRIIAIIFWTAISLSIFTGKLPVLPIIILILFLKKSVRQQFE